MIVNVCFKVHPEENVMEIIVTHFKSFCAIKRTRVTVHFCRSLNLTAFHGLKS